MTEEWRDIKGYEGLYQASSKGRIRSLDRVDNKGRKHIGIIRRFSVDGGGYYSVQLSKNGITKTIHVHRLIAETFIPNPDNKPTVNHIDENIKNNNISNLEWMTYRENAHHGTRMQRCYANRDYKKIGQKTSQTWKEHGRTRKIYQYDSDMNLIATYDSITDAAKINGWLTNGIGNALKHYGRCKMYKGFIWEYADNK